MEEYGHRTRVVELPDDYEGPVKATVVSLCAERPSASAVLYIHGYLDYYFQYHMGSYFAGQGRNFYALDLRKYGRSWMPHQHFNYCRRMEEYFPEIDAAIDGIVADGNTDITLLGHSTGGLLAALYCAEGGRRGLVDRLILNSPFLEFNTGWFVRKVFIPAAGALSEVFPYAKVKNVLSANYFPSVHASRYGEWDFDTRWKPEQAPPLYLAWLRAVSLAQRKVHRGLGLPMPVLVMFSDKSTYHKRWHEEALVSDTILNVDHIMRYGARLGDNVTLEEVSGGLHDLVLSRPEVREKVLMVMEYFIGKTQKA
jgi:alpha-beta hydrolase superfamily lysophospholipase